MSGPGTRRTTILKRRAGKTARLAFYAKRAGIAFVILGTVTYGFYAVAHSGWMNRTEMRTIQSFHEKTANAGFSVHNVLIEGRHNTGRVELKNLLGIEKDASIFSYDLDDLQHKIMTLTWVKSVIVERRLPDTIYIRLQERTPIALYQRDGKLALVDSEGVTLTDRDLNKFSDELIITGDQAPQNAAELIGLIEAEPGLHDRIEIARWIGNRRWDIKLKNGITLRLPEDDAGLAIKRLAEAQAKEKIMDRQVEAIDLRDPMRIVIQTAPGAVGKYEAGYKKEKNI